MRPASRRAPRRWSRQSDRSIRHARHDRQQMLKAKCVDAVSAEGADGYSPKGLCLYAQTPRPVNAPMATRQCRPALGRDFGSSLETVTTSIVTAVGSLAGNVSSRAWSSKASMSERRLSAAVGLASSGFIAMAPHTVTCEAAESRSRGGRAFVGCEGVRDDPGSTHERQIHGVFCPIEDH